MKRCLIIDDSVVVRRAAGRILGDSGFLMDEAATGAEALESCAQQMPEIIIVDSHLPDSCSIELIEQLYNICPDNRPFIVLITHEAERTQIMKAQRAGAKEHILKPFNRQQLLDRFRNFEIMAAAC